MRACNTVSDNRLSTVLANDTQVIPCVLTWVRGHCDAGHHVGGRECSLLNLGKIVVRLEFVSAIGFLFYRDRVDAHFCSKSFYRLQSKGTPCEARLS